MYDLEAAAAALRELFERDPVAAEEIAARIAEELLRLADGA